MKLQSSLLLLACLISSAMAVPLPPLQTIVDGVIVRDESIQKELEKYQYDQSVRIEKLDVTGQVKDTQTLEMVVRPGKEASYTIVADSKGGAFIPGEATDKQKKIAKDSEQAKTTFSLRKLIDRFDVALDGTGEVEGTAAYIVRFSPKPNQPSHDRTEKVLNSLAGRMWVSQQDYSILQTQAKLSQPVELAWFFATMESLTFDYHTQMTPVGLAPRDFNITFQVDVPFRSIRQRQFITMRDYRLK